MPVAEIIAIGTELLLGEIQDTNTSFIARELRENGIDLYRTTIVGDNPNRVAQAVRESLERAHITITTGGLGPTIDDPTREAIAQAVNVENEFQPELWEQIQDRFFHFNKKATENNRRQAFIPKGAIAIENPVGSAPAFAYEVDDHVIISLPGVPVEMEYLMMHEIIPYITRRFKLQQMIKTRVLHTAGVGESQVDEWISDLETGTNPTVGLLAHPGQVDIRIAAKASSELEVMEMINTMADAIHHRLGNHIFGTDGETLVEVVFGKLASRDLSIFILECGLNDLIKQKIIENGMENTSQIETVHQSLNQQLLREQILQIKQNHPLANAYLGASLETITDRKVLLHAITVIDDEINENTMHFGGHSDISLGWAVSSSLNFLRINL
jgi:nicotinamide-nucleotide amidase